MGRRVRVLVGEDDPAQRELLGELLEYEGYEVLTAVGPREVLGRLGDADVLFLDVHGVVDSEVRRALCSVKPRPSVLLASGDPRLAAMAAWLGADGCIAKPYAVEDLLLALRDALARSPAWRQREPGVAAASAES